MSKEKQRDRTQPKIGGLIVTVVTASLFYMLMEWLFLVTKPSFMDALPFFRNLEILLSAGSLLSGLLLLGLAPFLLVGWWLRAKRPGLCTLLVRLLYLAPAGVVGATLLLWLDNFTYTVFEFGIVSTEGITRAGYALVFLLLVACGYRLSRWVGRGYVRTAARRPVLKSLPLALVVIVGALSMLALLGGPGNVVMAAAPGRGNQRPNILLITSDGVNANHMSVYGYERDTTPNLRALAETALVAENAFTNSGNTSGSVISMYTGKYPTTTRVMYPPDILRGLDSYQHLPGILRSLGYRTVQISYPHFVDAYTLNVQNGFDLANLRTLESVYYKALNRYLPHDHAYFLYETSNRIFDRVRHIFFIKKMSNPFNLLKIPSDRYSEVEKLSQLLKELRSKSQPIFIHIHFMGTHGARFYPAERVFSQGIEVQEEWNVDFYDDAILEFDQYVGRIAAELEALGEFDDSILIVGSDHGQQFTTNDRIPLIMRFPNGEHAGRFTANAQNIDIAPTVLDYLGITPPDWMDGDSLLRLNDTQRPIIGFITHKYSDGRLLDEQVQPPFYQFDTVSAIYCSRWYRLNLETNELQTGEVLGYRSPCSADELPGVEEIVDLMKQHFSERGFDVSSIAPVLQP